MYPPPYGNNPTALTLQQTMNTCTGTNYSISIDYIIDSPGSGTCSVQMRYPYKTLTGSVTTSQPLYTWSTLVATFQAVSNADVFKVVMSCTTGPTSYIEVDNVKIAYFPGNAY